MLQNEFIIRIKDAGDIFCEQIQNGIKSTKKILPETFLECIRNSIRMGMMRSGVLPEGCVSFSAGEDDTKFVCLEFQEEKCDIQYEDTKYSDFPIPRLVFGFLIQGERIQSVRLGVVERGTLSPKSKMYVYPFSNVSGFNLCTGSNSMPNIKSLHQLCGIMYFIMSMPNNNDYYNVGNTKLSMEYRELLEELKDKTPSYYYSDVLIESGKVLSDFINY